MWEKIGGFFKKVVDAVKKFFFDMFTDIRNNVDEKRIWGNILMALGMYVVLVNAAKLDAYTWITAGGLFTFGIAILGIAAKADSQIGSITVPPTVTSIIKSVIKTKPISSGVEEASGNGGGM